MMKVLNLPMTVQMKLLAKETLSLLACFLNLVSPFSSHSMFLF
jgi:hypothetical protein